MTPPPPTTTAGVPTMRVAVELSFVRSCVDCRAIAERTAIAAIHDTSVTAFRAVPGTKHAHIVEAKSGVVEHLESSDQNPLFESLPQSDTNGFDPEERNQ